MIPKGNNGCHCSCLESIHTNKNTQQILYKKTFSLETKELLNVRTERKKKSEVKPDSP